MVDGTYLYTWSNIGKVQDHHEGPLTPAHESKDNLVHVNITVCIIKHKHMHQMSTCNLVCPELNAF